MRVYCLQGSAFDDESFGFRYVGTKREAFDLAREATEPFDGDPDGGTCTVTQDEITPPFTRDLAVRMLNHEEFVSRSGPTWHFERGRIVKTQKAETTKKSGAPGSRAA